MRPTTVMRGYGTPHRRVRRYFARLVASGQAVCWRCSLPIDPAEDWHLGHDDKRTRWLGPEHALCNLRAAANKANETKAKKRNEKRKRALKTSRRW